MTWVGGKGGRVYICINQPESTYWVRLGPFEVGAPAVVAWVDAKGKADAEHHVDADVERTAAIHVTAMRVAASLGMRV